MSMNAASVTSPYLAIRRGSMADGSMASMVNAMVRVNVATRTFQDIPDFERQLKDIGYKIMDL